ncbi:NAD(P)H-binding protein [Priestia megaterium]|uniref:NAD(P)H-binding protein n=1 Tax=Priestia megaterium TaxID=1404 RepID=UPI0032424B92
MIKLNKSEYVEELIYMENIIAIIGGTGKDGKYLAETAIQKGYKVRLLVRSPEKLTFSNPNVSFIQGDARDADSIYSLINGCDVVINTFGQPNRAKPLYSETTTLIVNTMKELEIKRYIGVTGGSLDIKGDKKTLVNKLGAIAFRILYSEMILDKKKELQILEESKLDWTLVRLPFVKEHKKSKKIKVNSLDMPGFKISAEGIAQFLIEQVPCSSYIRKAPFISN